MLAPILWTAVSVLALVLCFLAVNGGVWTYVFALTAIACAGVQWAVYFKKKDQK